jgi:hypothetical protein
MRTPPVPTSEYLLRPIRTLRTICTEAGRDDNGQACPTCLVRDLCELIERRLGANSTSGVGTTPIIDQRGNPDDADESC